MSEIRGAEEMGRHVPDPAKGGGQRKQECCWGEMGQAGKKLRAEGLSFGEGDLGPAGSRGRSLQASCKPLPTPGAFEISPEEGTRATAGEPAAVPHPVQHWKPWLPQSLGVLGFLAPNRSSF